MEISALLTSAGINISICIVLLSLYSILRKQPANYCVYFGRRLVCGGARRYDPFWYERFVPSPSWLVKAWETSEDELLAAAGLDAVVFLRMVIFSIRIFFITAVVCIAFVLPVNYYGQPKVHKEIHLESSEVFTIENLKEGSKWLWVHCLALYIITSAACLLLYFEYRTIAKMRLGHITGSASKPSQFTVLIRAIPWSPDQSYSDTLSKYFTNYYSSSYVSHQMVYHNGIIQRLLERPAAFVFFKTRYDALVVSEVLQSSNPMLWVTDLAPEPHDVADTTTAAVSCISLSKRHLEGEVYKPGHYRAGFFTTYCFTSGWASLACEIMQPMALIWNLVAKAVSKNKDESYETLRFPYHTEIPRLLLFGLLGFTNSVIAPLILPFLLIYFFLAYLIYKNQILNVYITKYESGGQYWPIFHNTTIFSLLLTQIIALGFFGLKLSTVASGFTIPLILLTLLFSEYCRHRFAPIFHKHPAQVLLDMDRADEMAGKMEELHKKLHNVYSQIPLHSQKSSSKGECSTQELPDPEKLKPEEGDAIAKELWGYQGNESAQEHEDKSCPSASSPEHRTPTMIELHKRS
ncbi:hypothetical protein YC2023_011183 [Brassica napus]